MVVTQQQKPKKHSDDHVVDMWGHCFRCCKLCSKGKILQCWKGAWQGN